MLDATALVVAHPARSREPRARRRVLDARSSAPSATTEAWTEREPDDAEAWFYLGGAYAARVQWRVLRDERLAAARDGKRIKEALERALALDPGLDDAYFGIGLYKYYADVAPTAAKFLRFLLLLPGGDREEGLRADAARARTAGGCCRARPTTSCTASISGTRQPQDRALELLRGLRQPLSRAIRSSRRRSRRSRTPISTTSRPASTRWRALLADGARPGASTCAELAEVRARLGDRADSSTRSQQTDRRDRAARAGDRAASRQRHTRLAGARPSAARRSARPAWMPALTRMAAYRSAAAAAPADDPLRRRATGGGAAAAGARTRVTPRPIRLSLDGWRELERKDVPAAAAALDAVARAQPARSGRALPLRPRARRRGATMTRALDAVRARDPRRARVPAADCSARAYLEARAPPRARRPTRRGDRRLPHRLDALRRRAETRSAAARALARLEQVIASPTVDRASATRSVAIDDDRARDRRSIARSQSDPQRDRRRAEKKKQCRFLTFRALCA